MLATVVETKELWQTAIAALVAGLGVTIVFSLAIYGGTRFVDLSRDDRPFAAALAILLALLGLAATLAAVAIGLIEMTRK